MVSSDPTSVTYVRSCMMESGLNLANSNSAMAGLLHLQQCLWISKTNPRTILLTPESRSELGMSVGIILQCNKLGSARGFGYTVSVPEDSRLSILWYLDTIIGPFMGTLVFKILVVHMNLRGLKGFFWVCFSGMHCIGIPLRPMADPDKFT